MPLKIQHDDQPTVNLTSMIDVVFLLIIFFMVATKFTELERNISLSVPKVPEPGAMTSPPDKRIVQLYRDGSVRLDRETVSLEKLTQRLTAARRQYDGLGVVIRGDAGCTFQRVAEVLSACRRAEVHELDIAVRPTASGETTKRW